MLTHQIVSETYPIQTITSMEKVGQGNSSDATLIKTKDNKYILRKLRDIEQAETEYCISNVLTKEGIVLKILLSTEGTPYLINDGHIYNLQIFFENQQEIQKIDFYTLGKTISLFHSATKKISGIQEQVDRFTLNEMWEQFSSNTDPKDLSYYTELENLYKQCLHYSEKKNCYIHGDLGKWNLLFNGSQIYLIDFGEVRSGNNHFDVAAVLTSTINWNLTETEILNHLTDFSTGYRLNFNEFSWSSVNENITLWLTRGMIAILAEFGVNDSTSKYIKQNLEQLKKINSIIQTKSL